MAVSVRMESLLEKELELAARQQGITKSQFIISAVEHALGRADPYRLLLQVKAENALAIEAERAAMHDGDPATAPSTGEQVRRILKAKHAAIQADWKAWNAADDAPPPAVKPTAAVKRKPLAAASRAGRSAR